MRIYVLSVYRANKLFFILLSSSLRLPARACCPCSRILISALHTRIRGPIHRPGDGAARQQHLSGLQNGWFIKIDLDRLKLEAYRDARCTRRIRFRRRAGRPLSVGV
jgi:hypothetical protein